MIYSWSFISLICNLGFLNRSKFPLRYTTHSSSFACTFPPGRSAIDDPSSIYFIHHSENPGLILVLQPLTIDNFASWSRAMNIALFVKNKLGFVDGSIPNPVDSDATYANAWIRNNIIISWLNSVSKEISTSILFAEAAAEIWKDLQERFQKSNCPRMFELWWDMVTLRQHQYLVSVYFTKLKPFWEELNQFCPVCNCGKCSCNGVKSIEAYIQMDYTMTFLMRLIFTNSESSLTSWSPTSYQLIFWLDYTKVKTKSYWESFHS